MGNKPEKTSFLKGEFVDPNIPIQEQNDPNDDIGYMRNWNRACLRPSDNLSRMNPFLPNNSEYEVVDRGGGNCHYCTNCIEPRKMKGEGCLGDGQGCGLAGGTVPRFRRKVFSAPIDQCCITGETMIGDKTCDKKYRGDSRFNQPECISHLKNHCSGTRIFTENVCKEWDNKIIDKNIIRDVKKNFCSGENTKFVSHCYNWCNSIKSDASQSTWYNQCVNDKWQQGYCSEPNRILDTQAGPCLDYCSTRSSTSTESDKQWCSDARKRECSKLYYNIVFNPSKAKELENLISTAPCACYLPDEVYIQYADSIIKQMGLDPIKDAFTINYIKNNAKCVYPRCSIISNPSFKDPATCPSISFCTQNVQIKVDGSTITGDMSTSQSLQCVAGIQNLEKDTNTNTNTNTDTDTDTNTNTNIDTSTDTHDTDTDTQDMDKKRRTTIIIIGIAGLFLLSVITIMTIIMMGKN